MALEGFALLFDLGMILIAATIFSFAARMLKQPPLLAYIAAGIFIGPMVLGSMGFSIGGIHLGVATGSDILMLSELGVAFLLFSVGIETNLSKFREMGKIAIFGTLLQVALTVLLVTIMHFLFNALTFEQSVYLGLMVAFSSTAIVVKLLSDSREINTLHGRLMVGFLLVQDLIAIIAMPFLANFSSILSVDVIARLVFQILVLLGIAYALNRKVFPKIFEFASRSDELFFLSAMSSVFFFIFLSYLMDFPIAVGAFIAGVTISTLPYSIEVIQNVRGVRDFLSTIFFVTLGIQMAPTIANLPIGLGLLIVAVVFLLKPAIFYAITLLSGYGNRISLCVGLALAQVSEFSFIIASQGKGILEQTPGLYPFMITLIALSMAMTPYFYSFTPSLYDFIVTRFRKPVEAIRKNHFFYRRINRLAMLPQKAARHIVIFGGGTVGGSIVDALSRDNQLVVVDSDPEVVSGLIRRGISAIYGSVENSEVWRKTGVEKARLVVLAMPFSKQCISLVRHLKKQGKKITVFARAHYFRDALSLYEAGADIVVMPQVVGSNLFVKKIDEFIHTGRAEEMGGYRDLFLKYLKEKSKEERKSPID
ncbi:Calcium-gated potassium channel MthK [uncultured archaeon]|nr:Calcium-gated potassium channel MthK [uncultured archaeon]